jgi:hypothetical protein
MNLKSVALDRLNACPTTPAEWLTLADAALAGAVLLLRSQPSRANLDRMADYLESVRDQRPSG